MLLDAILHGLFQVLNIASEREPKKDKTGRTVLRLPKLYGVIGLVPAVVAVVILIFGIFNPHHEEIWAILFCFILGMGLGLPLILVTWVYEVRLSDFEISWRNLLGRKKSMYWSEVSSVKFNPWTQELVISNGIKKARCHRHLIGFPRLLDIIYKKFNPTGGELRIPDYYDYPPQRERK